MKTFLPSLIATLILLVSSGCSDSSYNLAKTNWEYSTQGLVVETDRSESNYLAYSHSVTVETQQSLIAKAFEDIKSACSNNKEHHCQILESKIGSNNYSNSIRLRIAPKAVGEILKPAEAAGKIVSQSTNIVDLQDKIIDNNKRLDILLKYQERLTTLEVQATNDIVSLVQITEELAKVQSDLEYAQGEKSQLRQRIQLDIVNISFIRSSHSSFWSPIGDAFDEFSDNLSEGIASVIVGIAFLGPWIITLLLILPIARFGWRRFKRSK